VARCVITVSYFIGPLCVLDIYVDANAACWNPNCRTVVVQYWSVPLDVGKSDIAVRVCETIKVSENLAIAACWYFCYCMRFKNVCLLTYSNLRSLSRVEIVHCTVSICILNSRCKQEPESHTPGAVTFWTTQERNPYLIIIPPAETLSIGQLPPPCFIFIINR